MIAKYAASLVFVSLTSYSALAAVENASPLEIVRNSGKTVSLKDKIFVQVRSDDEELGVQYEVRRIDGKLVQSGDLEGTTVEVDASTLGKGVYFIKLFASNSEVLKDSPEFYRFQITN